MTEPSPSERAEAARVRRRWLTLGELLAVLAVLISAATLWNSWRERSNAETDKAEARAESHKAGATLGLVAAPSAAGDRLALAPVNPAQSIQGQTINFPPALGLSAVETTGSPRIEAAWLARALRRARKAAGVEERPAGDARLPIAITTRFLSGDDVLVDRATYDLGYAITAGGLFDGGDVQLHGLSLVSRGVASGAALDRLWKARLGK